MSITCKQTSSSSPLRLGHVFEHYGDSYIQQHAPLQRHVVVMSHIKNCRTERMGRHFYRCDHCDWEEAVWNSCRDRHCPTCQTMAKERWLSNRKSELLPVNYLHMVFTQPHELNPLIRQNPRIGYEILFQSVSETLQQFAQDPRWKLNGKLGYLAVLHTWTQRLLYHVHLHCIIPAGALSLDGCSWHSSPTPEKNFLFRVECLSAVFKNKYLSLLKNAYQQKCLYTDGSAGVTTSREFYALINLAYQKPWVVYAKKPLGGPESVLEYLGRYTHRTAISNNRLISMDDGNVTFTWRDRRDNNQQKKMTLESSEFIGRFLQHVLPKGFMRIRYFGFLSNKTKKKAIQTIRKVLGVAPPIQRDTPESAVDIMSRITGVNIAQCPKCEAGRLQKIDRIPKVNTITHPARGP